MSGASVLRMFGALRLETGEDCLSKFPTKKSALLLARLAIARNNTIGRDELAEQLWPDDFLDQTRLRLRQELRRLRQVVGDFGSHLHSDRQHVEIEPGYLITDIQMFDEAMAASNDASDTQARANCLLRAVGFLSGPFLAGYQEPWILAIRRDYEDKARRAWLGFADSLQELGDVNEALRATMNAVRHAPLDIEANACLIRRLVDCGQVAQARQACFEFDAMMFRELGQHAPNSVRAPLREAALEAISDQATGDPASRNAVQRPVPIYGRKELLESIQAAISRPGSCVVLIGTIGVGKTHLLREAAWQFSRENTIPIRISGEHPGEVTDGLLVIESQTDRASFNDSIRSAAQAGWRVLAESRTRFDSDGITEIMVGTLSTPLEADDSDVIMASPSIQLLLSKLTEQGKAAPVEQDIATLAELARRLDGLPAALKVFASRLMIQRPDQVLRSLNDGLTEFCQSTLSDGESVSSTIAKMTADLPEYVRDAFLALSFLDGASVDLAAAIAAPHDPAEIWRSLEKWCLIIVQDDGPRRRYRVPAPISYCAQSLIDEADRLQIAAETWRIVSRWAFKKSRLMTGPHEESAFDCVQAELTNIVRGLNWAIDADPALAGHLVLGAWRTVCARGNPSVEGEVILRGAMSGAPHLIGNLAGEAWTGTGIVLSIIGRLDGAEQAFLEALKIYESIGDGGGTAWANMNYASNVLVETNIWRATELSKLAADQTSNPNDRAHALCLYAMGLADMGEIAEAIRVGEAVFSERLQSTEPTSQGRAYGDLAELYRKVGRPEAARPLLIEGIRRLRETGIQDLLFEATINLAEISLELEDVRQVLDEANSLAKRMGSNLKLLEVARVRMAWASRKGDRPTTMATIEDTMRCTQLSLSPIERERSLRSLGGALEHFDKQEYANAIYASLGYVPVGPVHSGWKALLSSDSHPTVCVLAVAMAKEALQT